MKKIFLVSLMLSMVFVLIACDAKPAAPSDAPSSESSPESPSSEELLDSTSGSEGGLKQVEMANYTAVTSGRVDVDLPVEVGSPIGAYPLEINDVFANAENPDRYDEVYATLLVSFTGYVQEYKEGFFVLSDELPMNGTKYQNTIVCEDKNISAENGWDVADSDLITVVGRFRGNYHPEPEEEYIVLNEVFIVK